MGMPTAVLRSQTYRAQQLGYPGLTIAAAGFAVQPDRFANDGFHGHAWIQRGERVLKDDLQITANLTQFFRRQVGQVAAFVNHVARSRLQQVEQQAAKGGFTRAGLAYQCQRLALAD